MKWTFIWLPILLFTFATRSRADESSGPCALQWKAATDAIGTPEFAEEQKHYEACTAIAAEQQKADFAATRATWAASLNKLPNGAWKFLFVSDDGTFAVFGSHRHATREGDIVSLWLRYEYREQHSNGNENYKSEVERDMYNCARTSTKAVSVTYYHENNLDGVGSSFAYDESKVAWVPVIPGTLGDSLLDWACKTTQRAAAAKAQ